MLRVIAVVMLLAISSLAVGNCDGAGNCYVSSMATGTGTGANWTNACTDFFGACDVTSSSIRGTTIWVAGAPGNYLGASYQVQTFSAPDSGTTPVTIIAASAENHGTDTGFRKQFATAIVLFTGPLNITTDYWTFNGQFRAVTQNATESQGGTVYHDQAFGYHMQVNQGDKTANGAIQISGSNVILKYMFVQGAGTNVVRSGAIYGGTQIDNGIYYNPGVTNEYVGYSWIGWTGTDSISTLSGSNFIFEYNLFSYNHTGPVSIQSQAISVGDVTNLVIRYNHFQDITGSAILDDAQANATAFTPNWYFYGNDIFWDNQIHTGVGYGLSSGIVSLTGETLNGGVIHVYNNTIAGINDASCTTTGTCNSKALNLNGTTGGTCATNTRNCIGGTAPLGTVYNNLWWNPYNAANIGSNSAANPQWTPTGDYGEGICATTGCSNGGSFTGVGANDISVTTGNPFKSFSGTVGNYNFYTFNFLLTSNTVAGFSIPGASTTPAGCSLNCESNDPNYVTRGDNGTIDRGAFQIAARTLLKVATQNLAFGVHVGSTFAQTPVCTWSAPPLSDACPEGSAPFNKRWASLDKTVATVDSSGNVTGVSSHNSFIRLYYGGIHNGNSTTAVVSDGLGTEPVATLPTGIVRTGSPLAFSGYDTTTFDTNFPTTYSLPTGGHTWSPLTATDFNTALQNSAPGDVIVLQAGTVYQLPIPGVVTYFLLPKKTNPSNKWIYIISSNMGSLPPQGTRVSPGDAVNMPQILNTTGNLAIVADAGANHWWIAGVEILSSPSGGGAHPIGGAAFGSNAPNPATASSPMPDSITLDRCYIHATQDMNHSVTLNANHMALLDSYVGPGRVYQTQGNAGTYYFSSGPMKVINNFFSAYGEDFIFGGSGGFSNTWVVQDVYVKNNTFWKDPAWRVVGLTIPLAAPYEIVDNFEIKICSRCLIDGNLMQNSWFSAQNGGNIVVNTGTGVNGPEAVIDDITFSNNIITGGLQGVGGTEFAAENNGCGFYNSPCQYPGESRRVNYLNNLYIQGPQSPPGGRATLAANAITGNINRLMTDALWQHNTFVGPYLTDHTYCDRSIYLSLLNSFDTPSTQNLWLLDNVACRQIQGFTAAMGTAFLNAMMVDPTSVPYTTRFKGNVMQLFTAQGDVAQTWPAGSEDYNGNFVYNNPTTGDYTLVTPNWAASTSDGQQTGISYSTIVAHQHASLGSCSISGQLTSGKTAGVSVSITGKTTLTTWTQSNGSYTFPNLAAGNYTVTPFWPGYTFTPASIAVSSSTCATTGANFTSTQNSTGTITGNVTGDISSGITINMTFTDKQTALTDGSGNYSLSGMLIPGSYTVTPVHAGFTFTPPSKTVTLTSSTPSAVFNFSSTAAGATYSISGTVNGTTSSIVLNLTGTVTTSVSSDATTGTYTFNNLPNGTYTVTPVDPGYTFSPVNTGVTVASANVSGIDFTATPLATRYSIRGTVSGAIAAGVTLTLTGGANGTTNSLTDGSYRFDNLVNGSYVVTPSLSGYTFVPTYIPVTVQNANVPGQNFTSSAAPVLNGWGIGHIGPP